MALLLLSIGYLNFSFHGYFLPSKAAYFDNKVLTLEGKVLAPKRSESFFSFILKGYPSVHVRIKDAIDIDEGDNIKISHIKVHSISEKNYPQYLKSYYRRKGVYLYGWVDGGNIKVLGYKHPFSLYIHRLRRKIKGVFTSVPIIGAFVLGKEMDISQDIRDLFARLGIVHLFAVSGLHFGLIFLFLVFLGDLFLDRRKSSIISFIILTFYLFIVGTHPSVVRAYIMISTYVFAIFFYRKYDFLQALSLALIIILLTNPLEIEDPGFLLSFSSVLAIYLFDRVVDKELLIYPFYLLLLILWIWIFNFPIVVNFFHRVPLFSILFSPFLTFLASLFVIYAFFISLVSLIHPITAIFLLSFIKPFIGYYKQIMYFIDRIPLSSYIFPHISLFLIFMWYVLIFLIFYLLKRDSWQKILFVSLFLVFFILLYNLFPHPLNVNFIYVGEGDSIFIHHPGGANILVDVGSPKGGNYVVSFLKRRGVNRIDFLFLTHPDIDHWGGVEDLLGTFDIKKVFINGQKTDDEGYNLLLLNLREKGVPVRSVSIGDKIYIGDSLIFSVLNPPHYRYFEEDNNNSIVIGLRYGNSSVILTGDLEAKGERYLIDHHLLSHYDILKVAHHGSKSSTTPSFLDVITPYCAVISVGKNRYRHPSKKVVKLILQKGVDLYRTDIDGDIECLTYGHRWKIFTKRTKKRRNYGLSEGY